MLIKITEQMKWFDADVRATERPFEQRPEISDPVRMDVTAYIFLRVIDHLMHELVFKLIIRSKHITVHSCLKRVYSADAELSVSRHA